jgi:serine/threonine-protein kinase HipA
MEKVAAVLEEFCTFPVVEKSELLRRTVFSFVVGNEDMHLKNFSIIIRDEKVGLSPAYDLLNSTILLGNPNEELALPVRGRKSHLSKADIIDYFAKECLGLMEGAVKDILDTFEDAIHTWEGMINKSFLPDDLKEKYRQVVSDRMDRLGMTF